MLTPKLHGTLGLDRAMSQLQPVIANVCGDKMYVL